MSVRSLLKRALFSPSQAVFLNKYAPGRSKYFLSTSPKHTNDTGTEKVKINAVASIATEVPHSDGMDRYPHLRDMRGFLRLSDYIGTLAFASSGSILAASHGMDLLGAIALGTITAVGGGSIRDVVILGRVPFWSGQVHTYSASVLNRNFQ